MMRTPGRRILVALCPLVLSVPVLSPQTTNSTVANVYVQGKSGVYVYTANSNGQLTILTGSPFADTGQMEGINGAYLISVGTNYLHSYKIQPNGGVGSQAAQIDTASYGGGQCGATSGPSLLDHTGQYFAVQLTGASDSNGCAALQTYKIASTGQFTFLGDAESTDGYHGMPFNLSISTWSSNDLFAYGVQSQVYANAFVAFRRASAGDLVTNTQFSQTGPQPNPSYTNNEGNYFPDAVAADPSGHMAAAMNTPFVPNSNTFQLASFTINGTTGAISSSNTYANMPVLKVYPGVMSMSWEGNLLAVGGSPGLELFHFNGAAPPTAYGSVLLPSVDISQVAWDKSNHLYALSDSSQDLYVYTVTATSITPAPGSPYKMNAPYGWTGLIVVPK
jgi:hypothetical protein